MLAIVTDLSIGAIDNHQFATVGAALARASEPREETVEFRVPRALSTR
jgi:hypothetical protein